MSLASRRAERLSRINADAPEYGRVHYEETTPFGPHLTVDRFSLGNGLQILLCRDASAPVIAYHTWFRVGSRHEVPGKTGQAHLLEHLMFNEAEGIPLGRFDSLMEEAGAENNASTWLDFTQYQEAFPKGKLRLIVELEAKRMSQLILRQEPLDSEKEVVENERRYRVDDDVLGTVDEVLYKTAFSRHPYHWPTIGWQEDIRGFTLDDCRSFYETYYAPNNASLVLVGAVDEGQALSLISQAYGRIAPSVLPVEDTYPEPLQTEQRREDLRLPTSTEKLTLGYKGPALGDDDHVTLSVLVEVLTGGRASRLFRNLVDQQEVATDVRGHVGPHRDPSLVEFLVSARGSTTADELLALTDAILREVKQTPVSKEEIARAVSRSELGLLAGLETADAKANLLGFYECLLGQPNAAFERLRRMRRLTPGDLLRVARRYLNESARTIVAVSPSEEAR